MLRNAVIAMIMTGAVIATASDMVFPPKPILIYNPSASAPIGFYRLKKNTLPKLESQVAAYAPDWARKMADERGYLPYDYPLIKTVWAVEGDEVCYNNHSVSVPRHPVISVQAQDGLGRDMPVRSGCATLKAGEYFLVSPDVQTGFDSRYFGPVGVENIIGTVEFLGNSDSANSVKTGELGG